MRNIASPIKRNYPRLEKDRTKKGISRGTSNSNEGNSGSDKSSGDLQPPGALRETNITTFFPSLCLSLKRVLEKAISGHSTGSRSNRIQDGKNERQSMLLSFTSSQVSQLSISLTNTCTRARLSQPLSTVRVGESRRKNRNVFIKNRKYVANLCSSTSFFFLHRIELPLSSPRNYRNCETILEDGSAF